MAKRYSGNEFVSVTIVTPCSSSARTVIADSVIAASNAVRTPVSANGGAPTTAIRGAPKDALITATGSVIIAAAAAKSPQA